MLAHLSHSEGRWYRVRLDATAYEQRPHIERDDAAMHLDLYRDRDPEDGFAQFEEQRETNLEFLRELPPGVDAHTAAIYSELGEVTLGQILHEWALHDLGHIRQRAELVRARKYYPGTGAFQRYYHLKP